MQEIVFVDSQEGLLSSREGGGGVAQTYWHQAYTITTEPNRPTLFDPCPNVFHVKETYKDNQITNYSPTYSVDESYCDADHLGCTVFKRTKDDNQVAPSIQDSAAGFWIVGGKRRVSSIIHQCVTCRRLRAPLSIQKMASLPADHLSTDPPFTNVGLDVFGPWSVSSRRTRGGLSHSKRWAVIFTCMSIRAVHIEVIESLDTSSFINALRRFLAVRGPVIHIRSDSGTNFVSACKDLNIPSNIDSKTVKTYLSDQSCTWIFNPPHASHCVGTWERMIGLARRILDSMFLQLKDKLTHEVLVTFMAEVTAIINARPLVPVTTDPDESFILTPSVLLTQKVNSVSQQEVGCNFYMYEHKSCSY